jgi:hypothetical protein
VVVYIWVPKIANTGKLSNANNEQGYLADAQLLITLISLVNRLRRDCYFCDLALLIYTTVVYNLMAPDMWQFAYWEGAMILLLALIQYFIINNKGRFVIQTVTEIKIQEDIITIKTAAFNGPFWFRKEAADFRFKRSETTVKQGTNPFPKIFPEAKEITRMTFKNKEVYIMADYFSPQLAAELKAL